MEILFLCDGKRCEACDNPECKHTSDINHAVNFKKNAIGDFEENPAILEAKDSLTDLVKGLNVLLDNYIKIKGLSRPIMFANLPEIKERFQNLEKAIERSIISISEKIDNEVNNYDIGIDPKYLQELQEANNGGRKMD